MKKSISIICCACVLFLSSCGQSLNKITKVNAYIKVSIPGRAMANDKGETINPAPVIERFLIVENKGQQQPKIDTVYYNGIAFIPSVAKTDSNVGINKDNGVPVVAKTAKGNSLWKIELQQLSSDHLQLQTKAITIKLKGAGKTVSYTKKEIELVAPEMY